MIPQQTWINLLVMLLYMVLQVIWNIAYYGECSEEFAKCGGDNGYYTAWFFFNMQIFMLALFILSLRLKYLVLIQNDQMELNNAMSYVSEHDKKNFIDDRNSKLLKRYETMDRENKLLYPKYLSLTLVCSFCLYQIFKENEIQIWSVWLLPVVVKIIWDAVEIVKIMYYQRSINIQFNNEYMNLQKMFKDNNRHNKQRQKAINKSLVDIKYMLQKLWFITFIFVLRIILFYVVLLNYKQWKSETGDAKMEVFDYYDFVYVILDTILANYLISFVY